MCNGEEEKESREEDEEEKSQEESEKGKGEEEEVRRLQPVTVDVTALSNLTGRSDATAGSPRLIVAAPVARKSRFDPTAKCAKNAKKGARGKAERQRGNWLVAVRHSLGSGQRGGSVRGLTPVPPPPYISFHKGPALPGCLSFRGPQKPLAGRSQEAAKGFWTRGER